MKILIFQGEKLNPVCWGTVASLLVITDRKMYVATFIYVPSSPLGLSIFFVI